MYVFMEKYGQIIPKLSSMEGRTCTCRLAGIIWLQKEKKSAFLLYNPPGFRQKDNSTHLIYHSVLS